MSGSYLLDTPIVIGLFANDSSIVEKIKAFSESIYIPSIVFGELFYGAERSTRREENKKRIENLAIVSKVLECDIGTARSYGIVKSELKLKGTPIPENDIWIAALARQHGLTLISRDKHFHHVDELLHESW